MWVPEMQLLCPACSDTTLLPVYPPRCRCTWTGTVAELSQSTRTRQRQFTTYPTSMPFTRRGPTSGPPKASDT